MIFIHILRFNATFSSTPNISKSHFTKAFQVFLGLLTFLFPNTSISSTNLNTTPSVSLLTWPNHCNLFCLIYPVSISNHISLSPLHWRSCHVVSLSPRISTSFYCNYSISLSMSMSHVSASYNTTLIWWFFAHNIDRTILVIQNKIKNYSTS